MISFTLPGTLKPKERPRSGKGNFYTPRATQKQETEIGWLAKAAMNGHAILTGPVSMGVEIILSPPKSWSEERRATEHYATNKSDLDNQVKTICDALNSIVYIDDRQVAVLGARKIYSTAKPPQVRVTVHDLTKPPFAASVT